MSKIEKPKKILYIVLMVFALSLGVSGIAVKAGIKNTKLYVETYGTDIKECMIDHIIIEYDSTVELPKSAADRRKLYTFQDYWYGGTREVKAVYSNSRAKTRPNMKSRTGRFVIIQLKPIKSISYDEESYNKGLHSGMAIQRDNEEEKNYRRYNWNTTISFKQEKSLYSKTGKIVNAAGSIPIKNSSVKWENKSIPKITKSSVDYTKSMPYSYNFMDHSHHGTVTSIKYKTKDYFENDGKTYTKTAQVYLPYGYDKHKKKRYPILYYMHGTNGSAEGSMATVSCMIDNMINDGLIEPIIVVCPTYYTNNPDRDRDKGFHNQDVYDKEFRNDLMPAVESKFRTYAKKATEEGLKASREHRAFTGLSAGGGVTWQEFLDNSDYIANFIPLSGYIINSYDENGNYIIHSKSMQIAIDTAEKLDSLGMSYRIVECCGTEDEQMTEGVRAQYDTFTVNKTLFPSDRYKVLWTEGAGHENSAFNDGLYSALPYIFPGKYYKSGS